MAQKQVQHNTSEKVLIKIMLPNDGILCFSTMIQTHLSEEATQTEESGSSSHTDFGQIDDSSEEESVIERLSRLFSAVSVFCPFLSFLSYQF